MPDNYIDLPDGSNGVDSLNGLTGDVTLAAGVNITITPSGNTLTIAATGDGGVTSIGTYDSQVASANGLVISGTVLYAQSASATVPGMVSTGTQTFAGAKTFTGAISASNLSGTNTGNVTLAAVGASPNANGASLSGQVLTLQPADGTNPGLITAGVQTLGGNKTFTGTIAASNFSGSSSGTNTGDVTLGTANGLSLVGQALSLALSSGSTTGALSSADWTTFNNKQAAGNYITALTGDVTASGPGSVAATIAVGAVTDTKGSLANKPAVTVVATTNQTLSGVPTIDGQLTVAGTSIVLLSAQSAPAENGPWIVQVGAWTRPTWYPSGGTTQAFQFITTLVRLGTTYQGSTWRQTAAAPITIDTTATTWVVTPLAFNASTITGTAYTNSKKRSFGIVIDGGGMVITTGIKGDVVVPYSGTISSWTLLADQTGSIVIDVWKDTYANYPPTVADTIAGSEKPTLSAVNKNQDLTLTTWTTTVTAGDTIRFNVDSASTVTRVTLSIIVDIA